MEKKSLWRFLLTLLCGRLSSFEYFGSWGARLKGWIFGLIDLQINLKSSDVFSLYKMLNKYCHLLFFAFRIGDFKIAGDVYLLFFNYAYKTR